MTSTEFWPAGKSGSRELGLSVNQISSHLAEDWVPSVSIPTGSTLMDWPRHMIDRQFFGRNRRLCLKQELGSTDRQWKSMVSWMLGVACARRVLEYEGYTWVAPLSAFYPSLKTTVYYPGIPTNFASSNITAISNTAVKARLLPDYLALRPRAGGGYDWALVEAKGTAMAIENRSVCPENWYNQANNAVIMDDGKPIHISRHLVVATRVYPNGKRQRTRKIQIRCWNSEREIVDAPRPVAALDVISAHLYGLLVNLGLADNASALAIATRNRNKVDEPDLQNEQLYRAQTELVKFAGAEKNADGRWSTVSVERSRTKEHIRLTLDGNTINLLEALQARDQKRVWSELERVENFDRNRRSNQQEVFEDSLHRLSAGFQVHIEN